MAVQHNQTWDTDGNLIFEEWVEVPDVVDDFELIKAAALEKLMKLGLTEAEISALIGIS